jgi:hypothetical protein
LLVTGFQQRQVSAFYGDGEKREPYHAGEW